LGRAVITSAVSHVGLVFHVAMIRTKEFGSVNQHAPIGASSSWMTWREECRAEV
jgi:hypothetical protein